MSARQRGVKTKRKRTDNAICHCRATYSGDWWACTRLDKAPWDFSLQTINRFAPGVYDPDKDVWELRSALR